MEQPDVNTSAEPSAAAAAPVASEPKFNPSDQYSWSPEQREHWNQTGEIPEAPKKQASAPASTPEKKADSGPAERDKSEAESETAPKPQEKKGKKNAEERIAELTAKVRTLEEERERSRGPEPKPASSEGKPQPPATYAEWRKGFKPQEWMDQYAAQNKTASYEDAVAAMTDYIDQARSHYRQAEEAFRAAESEMSQKLAEGKERYPDFAEVIQPAATKILSDQRIPQVVKLKINNSPVATDLVYALASDQAAFAKFLEQAHSDPLAALDYVYEVEQGVKQELKKPKAESKPEAKPETPAEMKPRAPRPPSEVGGRGTAPEDPALAAVRAGDFRAASAEWDRRAMASRK